MIGMICANLILASRQGFGERKTEQLGGHSQEQQRHRQAPIDDVGKRAGVLIEVKVTVRNWRGIANKTKLTL